MIIPIIIPVIMATITACHQTKHIVISPNKMLLNLNNIKKMKMIELM